MEEKPLHQQDDPSKDAKNAPAGGAHAPVDTVVLTDMPAHGVVEKAGSATNPAHSHPSDDNDMAAKTGRWLYKHQGFFNGPIGWFSVKQVTRSLVASAAMMTTAIPVNHAFDWMNSYADKIKKAIGPGGDLTTIGKTAALAEEEITALGKRADMLKMIAGPDKPYKAILYVAAGFSMYRGTVKIFTRLYGKLFNPKNDEQKTIEEVRNLPHSLKEAVQVVAPAEFQSTPFAAVALGGLRTVFPATTIHPDYVMPKREELSKMSWGEWRGRLKNVLTTFKNNPVEVLDEATQKMKVVNKSAFLGMELPLNLLGYFTFFELGDRLFKDVQLRRGFWKGDANTTNGLWRGTTSNRPEGEETVVVQDGKTMAAARVKTDDQGNNVLLTTYQEKGPHGVITNDPSFGRLLLRGFPPVLVGITAYLGLHKTAKMFTGNLEPAVYGDGWKKNLARFGHNFKAEWVAIGMFFAYAMAKETWESWYDKNVVGIQKPHQVSMPSPDIRTASVANDDGKGVAEKTMPPLAQAADFVKDDVATVRHLPANEDTPKPATKISHIAEHEHAKGEHAASAQMS